MGDIRLRACKVDRAVRRVVVADHEHRASAPEFLRPGEDRPREVEFVADPAVVPGRAASLGEVAVDHHEPPAGGLEVRGHEPPLSVEPRYAQGGVHPDGLELRVEADTAIAPALGDRERGVPARWAAGGRRDVLGPCADLLDADDIGAGPVHKIHEPVPDTRANPVDVPAHDPHSFRLQVVKGSSPLVACAQFTGGARRVVARTRATAYVSALPIDRRRLSAPRPPAWPIAPDSTRVSDVARESARRSRRGTLAHVNGARRSPGSTDRP